MARTRKGRLRQVEAWLWLHYPPPLPTALLFGKRVDGDYGYCDLEDGRLVVRIDNRLTWFNAIEWAIHEWSHAFVWGRERVEHNRVWSDAYGKIYQHWHNQGGAEESRNL